MRDMIEMQIAKERQAELRAAARALSLARREQRRPVAADAPRVFGFRLSLAR